MRAVEAAARIRAGALTSVELVTACLDRIEETDAALRAWTQIDRDDALEQAREMDSLPATGACRSVPCTACRSPSTRSSVQAAYRRATVRVLPQMGQRAGRRPWSSV